MVQLAQARQLVEHDIDHLRPHVWPGCFILGASPDEDPCLCGRILLLHWIGNHSGYATNMTPSLIERIAVITR